MTRAVYFPSSQWSVALILTQHFILHWKIPCSKIVRELKIGGLTVKRRWLHQLCLSIFCVDHIFPLLLLLPLLPDCLRRAVAKTLFVPFQLATTQLVGEAEGYFVLHLAVQASTILLLLYIVGRNTLFYNFRPCTCPKQAGVVTQVCRVIILTLQPT